MIEEYQRADGTWESFGTLRCQLCFNSATVRLAGYHREDSEFFTCDNHAQAIKDGIAEKWKKK